MDIRGVPYENNPPLRENILTVGMCGFTSTMSQLSRYTGGDEVTVLANDHVICSKCHRIFEERYKWHEEHENEFVCEQSYGNGNRNDARSCWRIIREAWHTLWTNNVAEDECKRQSNHNRSHSSVVESTSSSSSSISQYHEEHLNEESASHDLCFPVIYKATCNIAPRLLHNIFACPEVHEVVHSVNCCQCCQGPLEQTHSCSGNNNLEHEPLRCYEMNEETIYESNSCCCCCECCCWTCNPIHWLLMFKEWMCAHMFHVKPRRCCYSELGRTNMGGNRDQIYFTHQIRRAVELLQREEAMVCSVNVVERYESREHVNCEELESLEEESRHRELMMEGADNDDTTEDMNETNNNENIVTSCNNNNKSNIEDAENVTDSINTVNVKDDDHECNINRQEEHVYIKSNERTDEPLHLDNNVQISHLVEQQATKEMDVVHPNAKNSEVVNSSINNNNVANSENNINYCVEPQNVHNTNNESLAPIIASESSSPPRICNHYNNNANIHRRRHLVLFGVSRGATTCFYTSMKLPAELASYVSLVVVEAPFDTLQHVIASSTWFPSLTMWLFKSFCDYRGRDDENTAYSYDPAQVQLRCPVAFVLSQIDERVPNACTVHLINTLKERLVPHVIPAVEVLVLKHSRHPCMPLSNKADQDAYVAFVERLYATYCS